MLPVSYFDAFTDASTCPSLNTPLQGGPVTTLAKIENLCYIKSMLPKQAHHLYSLLTHPAATRPLFRSSIVYVLYFFTQKSHDPYGSSNRSRIMRDY